MRVLIGLGSNLGDRRYYLTSAINCIERIIGIVVSESSVYETDPLNHPDNADLVQGRFLNSVIAVETDLGPEDVLKGLLSIEDSLGRKRAADVKWGPRTIDLDLIDHSQQVVQTQMLTLPHPEMHKRSFVLMPIVEIDPTWRHPVLAKTAGTLLKDIEEKNKSANSDAK